MIKPTNVLHSRYNRYPKSFSTSPSLPISQQSSQMTSRSSALPTSFALPSCHQDGRGMPQLKKTEAKKQASNTLRQARHRQKHRQPAAVAEVPDEPSADHVPLSNQPFILELFSKMMDPFFSCCYNRPYEEPTAVEMKKHAGTQHRSPAAGDLC